MTDIVERLRRRHGLTHDPDQLWDVISTLNKDADEAADEIERLRAQVVSLQSSLDAGPPIPGKKTPAALKEQP